MRIIAGQWKGQKLLAVPGDRTRPTVDQRKEQLFSILQSYWGLAGSEALAGLSVLDLCAGTGQLGLEALSRGAARLLLVEKARAAAAVIKQNVERCQGASERCELWTMGVEQALPKLVSSKAKFDLILWDPPYAAWLGMSQKLGSYIAPLLSLDGVLLLEHDARDAEVQLPGLEAFRHCQGGVSMLSFYAPSNSEAACESSSTQEPLIP